MLKRKITEKLIKWKNTKSHKPLIIKGLRQSGKTYSVLEFAKLNYKSVIYINFQNNNEYKNIFAGNLEIEYLKIQISAFFKEAKFIDNDTIIILDEIQECSRARLSLKFFAMDGRYDVVATGSLLGLSGLSEDKISIPVGYEEEMKMFPLDFEEFIWSKGIGNDVIEEIKRCFENKEKVPLAIHNKMRELLLQYIVVGGMPAVVQEFIDTNNINNANAIKNNILNSFRDDMVKYAYQSDKTKIKDCFNSIPYQLAKENKKFQYSLVKKKATSSTYQGVIEWLEDFGIIKRCFNISNLELPLAGNSDNNKFKIYISDIGLLISLFEEDTDKDIISGNLGLYKGAIYENLFADYLIKNDRKLYYYHKQSSLEIDFIIKYEGKLTLVEVKATNGNAKSLKTVLNDKENKNLLNAIKVGDYNIGMSNNILTIPFYIIWLVKI